MNIYIGDTHGDNAAIMKMVDKYDITDVSLIHVGDYGIGMRLPWEDLEKSSLLNDFLVDRNIKLYILRGNHDCPLYFEDKETLKIFLYETHETKYSDYKIPNTNQYFKFGFDKSFYAEIANKYKGDNRRLKNIEFVKDYSLLNINNENVFFIGGSISIDRHRRNFLTHWEEEKIKTLENFDFLENGTKIDTVVTHNAPSSFYPPLFSKNEFGKFMRNVIGVSSSNFDERAMSILYNELIHERNYLEYVYNELFQKHIYPKNWVYGHFHKTKFEMKKNGLCAHLLNINEFKEI